MDDSLKHRADLTKIQFKALRTQLNKTNVVSELQERKKLNRLNKNQDLSDETLKKWLRNAWNTERILRTNRSILEEDENFFALQWSFPQAYYSIFCSAQGFFHAAGRTANSHGSTMRDISKLIEQSYYPKSISLLATGGKQEIEFKGLKFTPGYSSKYFNEAELFSVENQIAQLLRSTREYLLDDQKDALGTNINDHPALKNSKGVLSGRLNSTQRDYVSQKLGSTNILHFLYRKRIKSNYREIDTFQFSELKALEIHDDIIEVTSYFNFVHEAFIYKALGKNKLKEVINSIDPDQKIDWLNKRFVHLSKNL